MKQILVSSLIPVLRSRIYISRELQIFNLQQIANGWRISRPTLYRYDSDEYREKSRIKPIIDKLHCGTCSEPLKSHNRCVHCTILVHEIECSCAARIALIHQKNIYLKPTNII